MSVTVSTRAALVAAVVITIAGCAASAANPTPHPPRTRHRIDAGSDRPHSPSPVPHPDAAHPVGALGHAGLRLGAARLADERSPGPGLAIAVARRRPAAGRPRRPRVQHRSHSTPGAPRRSC